jgi:hypothetical protein
VLTGYAVWACCAWCLLQVPLSAHGGTLSTHGVCRLGVLRMVSAAGALECSRGTLSTHGVCRLGVLRMVSAAGALECSRGYSEYSRGILSLVPSNLRATSLQADAHALVALTPAHVCVRTSAYPRVHLQPASALICAQMGCGSPLPATAPRLAPRARACGSVSVCLCVCAHT